MVGESQVYIFFAAGAAFFVCPASVPRLLSLLTAQGTGPMKDMVYDFPAEGLRWCENYRVWVRILCTP